jgi:RNA polymerase sigma-70 factor (sigma-E family)
MPEPADDDGWPVDLLALFTARRGEMVRLAHLITNSNVVAEDIVQEAFVALRRHWGGVDRPVGYLRASVVNLARGHLRRSGVEQRHAQRSPAEGPLGGDPEIDETWAEVCRLPPTQRAVVVLRFYEDLTHHEIAQALGCSVGNVKSSLHRALARLRKELS